MGELETYIRQYVWNPYGERIRGAIAFAVTEAGQVLIRTDWNTLTDWKSWTISLAVAAGQGFIHYLFGKVPAKAA